VKACDIRIRDPFVLPANGRYYLYNGLEVHVSDDLENWSEPTQSFVPPPDFWSHTDFWAPEVHAYNGRYYMFITSISDTRNRGTQILIADDPMGPFVPYSDGPVTPEEWMCLDGTLYVEEDGTPYMVFCHEWVQVKNGGMCAIQLTPDLKEPVGEPMLLFKASELPGVVSVKEEDGHYVTDGPFMYRTAAGKLLMIWSSFGVDGYLEAIAWSDNNKLTGKWIQSKKLLFSKDGGHGMIFRTYDGRLMFACHSPNSELDERLKLIEICEDGDLLTVKA